MANVIIASPKSNAAKRIEFSGRTFGELKQNPVFRELYGNGDGVDAILNPGNLTLRADDSALPEGDFKVFIVATKNKAGDWAYDVSDVLNELEPELERIQESNLNAIKDALLSVLGSFQKTTNPSGDSELSAALAEANRIS